MFRPVPTTEKMALAIIHQVMKPAFFVQHVMITCRSIMNIPRQKNVILWGSKASHDCKVQIDTLLPKKCFHWHLPRKHFHNSQVMQKSRELPPSDALVKVLDENERDMGIMPFKKLELLARKEQKQFVHLRNTKHKPSRHQVFILLSNNAVSQNPNDHTVDGKITNRKSLQLELKTKITDHDLGHKMRKAQQWIAKGHSVEILIIKKDENVKVCLSLYGLRLISPLIFNSIEMICGMYRLSGKKTKQIFQVKYFNVDKD